ncbi:MAG: hypothetical protein J7M11_00630 [Elusimicrobia bacterium]|nr:hypothetical protein [Elusimicrobiota bacterium]
MLNLALDISYEPIDDRKIVSFGTEYWPTKFLAGKGKTLIQSLFRNKQSLLRKVKKTFFEN